MNKNNDPDLKTAVGYRKETNFFILAMTFTMLMYSIKTAELGNYLISDIFEIISWLCLFVSGIFGIIRNENIALYYELYSQQKRIEIGKLERLKDFKSSKQMILFIAGIGSLIISRIFDPISNIIK